MSIYPKMSAFIPYFIDIIFKNWNILDNNKQPFLGTYQGNLSSFSFHPLPPSLSVSYKENNHCNDIQLRDY